MTEIKDTLSSRLYASRVRAGFRTQTEFAETVGVPQPTYHQHEKGTRGIDEQTARKYADHLGVDWMWLLHGSEDRGAQPTNDMLSVGGVIPLSAVEQAWHRVCVKTATAVIKKRNYPEDEAQESADMLADVLFSKVLDALKQGKSDADILHEIRQNSPQ